MHQKIGRKARKLPINVKDLSKIQDGDIIHNIIFYERRANRQTAMANLKCPCRLIRKVSNFQLLLDFVHSISSKLLSSPSSSHSVSREFYSSYDFSVFTRLTRVESFIFQMFFFRRSLFEI